VSEDVASDRLRAGVDVRPAQGPTTAVVLLLHGGKEHSYEHSDPMHYSYRRMQPFARALHRRAARHGVAVWTVRYRVRGWNAPEASPVADARWALEEVRRRHGDVPVVLLGHSMGGRVAVHVLDDPSVVAMAGLAPWIPDEPADAARDRDVLVAHGVIDRWTSPRESLDWAERARDVGASVTYVRLRRTGHFLLRRHRLWTHLAVGFCLGALGLEPSVGRRARALLAQRGTTVTA
jgi:pimeloyl-ACP methyl ester carboxylesterase